MSLCFIGTFLLTLCCYSVLGDYPEGDVKDHHDYLPSLKIALLWYNRGHGKEGYYPPSIGIRKPLNGSGQYSWKPNLYQVAALGKLQWLGLTVVTKSGFGKQPPESTSPKH
ncbi:hypothetical protein B0T18DRAFT_390067 [Schizothecium vesticola]|uniref:Secreted protein n=1 Tax=Schizothecium vesticola TaxID=314040 RepID=A0AA40ETZ8_9PEZI|nr:hypothetical protein B0T18DRAFT_390067 [Schizothecium vesticola]